MKKKAAVFFLALTLTSAWSNPNMKVLDKLFAPDCALLLVTKVLIFEPLSGPTRADFLYLHGFGDRPENHIPLFETWATHGFRVITLDLPSHGDSRGLPIDFYSFRRLGGVVRAMASEHRKGVEKRPLFLSGWSTGGLVAMRMVQMGFFSHQLAGVELFAPPVSPRFFVGRAGVVTDDTLTRNPEPPHFGKPKPRSPFFHPFFALNLLANARSARKEEWPHGLPTMVFLGGKGDRYIHSENTAEWFRREREAGASIEIVEYANAFHELDNEPNPVGENVRFASTAWALEHLPFPRR